MGGGSGIEQIQIQSGLKISKLIIPPTVQGAPHPSGVGREQRVFPL
jgi:hypothetical protein